MYRHDCAVGYGGIFLACCDTLTTHEITLSNWNCELVVCQIQLNNRSSLHSFKKKVWWKAVQLIKALKTLTAFLRTEVDSLNEDNVWNGLTGQMLLFTIT